LHQLEQDVLDVFADVAGLGQGGGVSDGERHVEHAGQRLGHERLAAARGADEHDVGLLQLNVFDLAAELYTLVVVVDGHRHDALGLLLPNDVLVEEAVDLARAGQLFKTNLGRLREFFFDDLVAEIDALIADIDAGSGDELLYLLLRFPTEGAL